jgi:hypothetical protein
MSPSLPLTPVQERVLSLIGTGSTISDAARSVGVHRNTIGNWIRSSPLFKDGLACAQYDQVLFWREHAQLLADSALQAIQQIIEDDRATPSTRLRAALAIFQMVSSPVKPNPYPPVSSALLPVPDAPPAEPENSENLHKNAQSESEKTAPTQRSAPKTGRNDVCPCGSGLKFKRCCLGKSGDRRLTPAAAAPPCTVSPYSGYSKQSASATSR